MKTTQFAAELAEEIEKHAFREHVLRGAGLVFIREKCAAIIAARLEAREQELQERFDISLRTSASVSRAINESALDAAATVCTELEAAKSELATIKAAIADPAAVWANMLRGQIAKPEWFARIEGELAEIRAADNKLQDDLAAAKADNARLWTALEPFAVIGAGIASNPHFYGASDSEPSRNYFSLGQLRRAAETLWEAQPIAAEAVKGGQ